MFRSALQYAADSSVRAAAVRAYVAFLCDNDEDATVIRHLSDMIPSVLKVCYLAAVYRNVSAYLLNHANFGYSTEKLAYCSAET
jgi:hypothetical protein